MKRAYLYYLLGIVPALVLAFVLVQSLTLGEHGRALRQLGKGERMYREARESLVLGSGNPVPSLVEFVENPRRSVREREHALAVVRDMAVHRDLAAEGPRIAGLLQTASPELVPKILETVKAMESPQAAPLLAAYLTPQADSLAFSAAYGALRAASFALLRKLKPALRSDDTLTIDTCLQQLEHVVGAEDFAYEALAGWHEGAGRDSMAAYYSSRTARVDTVWAVGPFPNESPAALAQELSPELRPFNPRDTFHVKDGIVTRWTPTTEKSHDGYFDLTRAYPGPCCSAGYLFFYVNAQDSCDALLLISSPEPSRIWLNGELVYEYDSYRPGQSDEDVARVRLNKGPNTVRVKSLNDLGSWKARIRVVGYDGDAMNGVEVGLRPVESTS